jgi:hypothetical protein
MLSDVTAGGVYVFFVRDCKHLVYSWTAANFFPIHVPVPTLRRPSTRLTFDKIYYGTHTLDLISSVFILDHHGLSISNIGE